MGHRYSLSAGLAKRWLGKDKEANCGRQPQEPGPAAIPDPPPHFRLGGHWPLVAARPKRREIRAFDSLGNPRLEEAGCVRDFFTALTPKISLSSVEDQRDVPGYAPPDRRVSCGVYVCKFADKLRCARRVEDCPIDVTRARKVIAGVLRRQRFDLENFFANETPWLMAHRRFTSSRLDHTPPVIVDITTPDGVETVRMQGDPSLTPWTRSSG